MKIPDFINPFKKKEILEVEETQIAPPKVDKMKRFTKMIFGDGTGLTAVDKNPTPLERQLGHADWIAPVNRRPAVAPPIKFNPSTELKERFGPERCLIDKPLRPGRYGPTKKRLHKGRRLYLGRRY